MRVPSKHRDGSQPGALNLWVPADVKPALGTILKDSFETAGTVNWSGGGGATEGKGRWRSGAGAHLAPVSQLRRMVPKR